ncbi:hypothetical protein EI555_007814 [Monodon monoceros]|uniref:Eukaryotic translation initiation factor 4 gamma 2 n=1 Tax=Monodon monoceros TaxID=40151 RepID=A0A4U1F7C6_MONMO|nr:hypothetical protein EI555_007814 [Monodon monoceros]
MVEAAASRSSASSGGGGSRGAPQHCPRTAGNSEFLGRTPGQNAQKWIPASSTRRDDDSAANNSANEKERRDAIFRKVRGILRKLTPEKFERLCLERLSVGVECKLILKGVILLIVDKALEEPKYSSLYAQLCLRLAEDAPNFDGPAAEGQPGQKQSTTFRRLLISKLQEEFENRTGNVDVCDKRENPLLPKEKEQRAIAKTKMLGNIKFTGEPGKLDLIHESILHKCIKTLLEKKKRVQLKDMGEDLECLCQIMRRVGPRLDQERAKSLMDQYFARMCSLMLSKELPARIRFLLQDTIELREHHWVPRKAFLDSGPKTINQIRQDAVKDLGVFIPAPMAQGMRSDFFLEGRFVPPRMKMDRDPLGALADMFGQMPDKGFVNILMTSFLQYISSEVNPPSDETDSSSAPSTEQLEQEKQLLLSFKPVMQKSLHVHVDLQVSALYALQVHCYNSNFPKGMLLCFFVHFHDMEVIEGEAFLAWKEDITQEFPGKGKALFHMNQWLTWLETAEEEESEEEAG